jgi:hypothetical protein
VRVAALIVMAVIFFAEDVFILCIIDMNCERGSLKTIFSFCLLTIELGY